MTIVPSPIRVLVVDDSAITRRILCAMLATDPQIVVVGEARDGREAVELTEKLHPDVITMDARMPRVDGLQATEEIMAYNPTPILVLTASLGRHEGNFSFQMLNAGALEVLEKPKDLAAAQSPQVRQLLLDRIKVLSRVKVVTHLRGRRRARPAPELVLQPEPVAKLPDRMANRLVLIGASTGGPRVLYNLLRTLPATFPACIVIVQHIAEGFVNTMVEWLASSSPLHIALAADGMSLQAGHVLVAPDTHHLRIGDDWRISLDQEPKTLLYPSIDIALQSVARRHAKRTIGVVLTGMGRDGANGLLALRQAGGRTVAQDQASSAIWGMPRAASELGAAMEIVAADELGARLVAMLKDQRVSG
ncbi:MAG: chemotaxis-specific protein-glutamate methyltransferase CheB [Herpetosiphonaceae bacterium]|nr:chemotaxis-specific protein-glutamate methyltransferase CheB [Herpetosiphonaceae bacterium]